MDELDFVREEDELPRRAVRARDQGGDGDPGDEPEAAVENAVVRFFLSFLILPPFFFLFLLDGCVRADADMLFISFSVYRQQADLIVKPPKGSGGSGGAHSSQQAGVEFYLGE